MENLVIFIVLMWILITMAFSIFTAIDQRTLMLLDVWRPKLKGELYITEINGVIHTTLVTTTNILKVRFICWNANNPTDVYLINSDRGAVIDYAPVPGYKTADYNLLDYNSTPLLGGGGLSEVNNLSCVFLGKGFIQPYAPIGQ